MLCGLPYGKLLHWFVCLLILSHKGHSMFLRNKIYTTIIGLCSVYYILFPATFNFHTIAASYSTLYLCNSMLNQYYTRNYVAALSFLHITYYINFLICFFFFFFFFFLMIHHDSLWCPDWRHLSSINSGWNLMNIYLSIKICY